MGHNINGVEITERALAEFKKKCLLALRNEVYTTPVSDNTNSCANKIAP